MIILSQDKNKIVNLNNIDEIIKKNEYAYVDYESEDIITANSIIAEINNKKIYLGIYETEDRANKVMKEIINQYRHGIIRVQIENCKWVEQNPIYEMPEE